MRSDELEKPLLIGSPGSALIAGVVLGVAAGASTYSLFAQSSHVVRWTDVLPLPMTAASYNLRFALSFAFFAYLFCMAVWFARAARREERIVAAGWFAEIALLPLRTFPALAPAVAGLQAIATVVAFVACATILLKNLRTKTALS